MWEAGADAPTARSQRQAATDLRAAVHALASASLSSEAPVHRIDAATELVREAAALLVGDDRRSWDGPVGAAVDGLRSYRARSLFQGALHPFSSDLRWLPDAAGPDGRDALAFDVTLSEVVEGPPGAVHGGYVAGLFDELLGAVQGRADGGGGVTGRLQVRYRRPVPLRRPVRFEGWLVSARGRRLQAAGRCLVDEAVHAEAQALFVRPRAAGGSR